MSVPALLLALALSATPAHVAATVVAGAPAPPRPPLSAPAPVAALERFLARHVAEGRVDYGAIRASGRGALDTLIAGLAAADTARWAPARRLALQLDLYDLVMIRAVVDRWKPGWTPAADGFAVFKAPLVPTRQGAISLDELEKPRTLERFKDPRAHVAFNCAARSCPPLPSFAWSARAGELDRLLEERLRALVRTAQVDDTRRLLRLPRLFQWYEADFGGHAGVMRLVARHLGRDLGRYKVEYLDYDWSLNAATYPDGSKPR